MANRSREREFVPSETSRQTTAQVKDCTDRLTMTQNNIASLSGLVAQLALVGEYAEAERYLARLEEYDESGTWAIGARTRLGVLRGDLPAGSERLRIALDNPASNDFIRGFTHFMLGDVAAGVEAWRSGRRSGKWPPAVAFRFSVNCETSYRDAVVNDPRYQDCLDELGIGRRWTAYLRERVAELAPITGIEPGDPAPQKAQTR